MKPNGIPVLDMTVTGRYADGAPMYKFTTSFPSRGVRALPEGFIDKEEAYQFGKDYIDRYKRVDPYGNMGQCLGVTEVLTGEDEGLFRAVVNTFHSNT